MPFSFSPVSVLLYYKLNTARGTGWNCGWCQVKYFFFYSCNLIDMGLYVLKQTNRSNQMTNKVVKIKQSTKVSKDEKKFLLNYGMMKETIKGYKKQMELMTPEIAGLFERVKSNLIVLVDMDNDFEGFAQKINRKMKRFDVSRFKDENTELYEKYLIDSESTEYKVEYKLARQA